MASEYQFDVTFFVPCYNEEKVIYRTLDKIAPGSKRIQIKFEIIVLMTTQRILQYNKCRSFKKTSRCGNSHLS